MRIAIVQFPGSNCERETALAVKRANMQAVEFLWNEPLQKFRDCDGYIIVGGFSYEDRSRAGIIAALDPLMHELKIQSELGKPILGICNGAQILIETGMVPGLENNKIAMALAENKRIAHGKILGVGYYNTWVHLKLADPYQRNAFTRYMQPNQTLFIPIAHGEGRFVMTDALLAEIQNQGLGVLQYCDEQGQLHADFPTNPNGSIANIAAVSNKAGNVMAMMPHPERSIVGDVIFRSMHDYIKQHPPMHGWMEHITPLYYYPRRMEKKTYKKSEHIHEWRVELMITDHQALTVQQTLQQHGIAVDVKREVHWELDCDETTLAQIKKSGVVYNERKERLMSTKMNPSVAFSILVRAKEDLVGLQTMQTLQDHFDVTNLTSLKQGILWHFYAENASIPELIDNILSTNIICNPYAHDYVLYST